MEGFKKYLPWIVVGAVVLFLIRKLGSGRTVLAPQTQFTETAQPDPFAAMRAAAFEQLVGLGIVETQAGVESEKNRLGQAVAFRAQDVELERIGAFERAATRAANLGFLEREQDREGQQRAIDRYYSSRQTSDIVGSITGALSNVFSGRGQGPIFGPRTPPINPNFGGFF